MMKKLIFIIAVPALVMFAACDSDATEMDVSVNGEWLAMNGTRMEMNGLSYTRTSVDGEVNTGTYSAAGGFITFSRIGHTPETLEYTLEFPELRIGGTVYYHDSPNEPVNVEGRWLPYPSQGSAVTFSEGKRLKDENKKETFDIEGDFTVHYQTRGKYTLTNRNLPGQSFMVTVPTHIHGSIIFMFINLQMPISLLELFDASILTPPEAQNDVEEWWFTMDEVRSYFEEAAGKASALDVQASVFRYMRSFLSQNEASRYDYSVEHDRELFYLYSYWSVVENGLNKLTLRTSQGGIYTYFKWDGETGTK
jgi:hypothetical protein